MKTNNIEELLTRIKCLDAEDINSDERWNIIITIENHLKELNSAFFCDAKLVNGESPCKKQCNGCFKCLHRPKK